MSFRDFLNERYNDQFEDLSEMANVTKMDSGLPFAVWIDFNGVRRKVRHNSPRIKIEIDNARIPYLIDNSNPDFLVNDQFKKKLLKHIPAKNQSKHLKIFKLLHNLQQLASEPLQNLQRFSIGKNARAEESNQPVSFPTG
jgi:hypothetical protein